ncbi:D-lactate dehydrogenase, partial [Acinetobacter sp. ULE_I064]
VELFLNEYFQHDSSGHFFRCTDEEGRKAFLHRFAVAGAAIRDRDTHRSEVEYIVALDIALRRNDREWVETLPKEMYDLITHKLYYGHFICHVFHKDNIFKKVFDP